MTTLNVVTYRTGPGDALPVVLLHAFPLDHRMWDDVAAELPPTRPVHAVDLPGTPGNDEQLPPPSLDTSALRVAKVCVDMDEGSNSENFSFLIACGLTTGSAPLKSSPN